MKLPYHLPAAFYSISSSISYSSLRRATAITVKSRHTFLGFRSSSSATHHRRHYHSRHRRHLFPYHSTADNKIFHRHGPLRQRKKHLHKSNKQNNNPVRHLATSSDPDSIPRDASSDVDPADTESTRETPSFQLFYNDVYEVKLPPRHRFPMGKYRKVRERVQDLISKLPQENRESVNCGEYILGHGVTWHGNAV